ncbi:gluconate dehydrogenase [Pseudomonas aeruginosa]|nr:gluconate dehydrogenase [Pseudomonas aeruginosa]
MATIKAFFDKDVHTNPFVGTGGGGVAVDDFNADNFDHGPLGFVGGSPMWVNQAGSKPIGGLAVPPGTPSWGSGWKQAVKDAYTHTVSMDAHGSNMTYRDNYLDLDPTYKDAYGQPLLRMTFDWKDNEIRMSRYVTEHMRKIAEAMNPKAISVSVKNFGDHFNTRVYQTTHLLGGAIMAAIRRPACSTATCRAGTCTTSSSWAPRPSPRAPATTPLGWWRRWPTGRPRRSASNT